MAEAQASTPEFPAFRQAAAKEQIEPFSKKTLAKKLSLLREGNPFLKTIGPPWNRIDIFKGRPMISRDRPINGGVYVTAGYSEAIVVDDTKDAALNQVYQELLRRLRRPETPGRYYKDNLLEDVWNLVRETIPYDREYTDWIVSQIYANDAKVELSKFFPGGVCRHQALLVAYLLERFINEGLVNGRISVDRNSISGRGSHAWARFVDSAGEVWIIDPAQNLPVMRLDEVPKGKNRWLYERPEDRSKLLRIKANINRFFMGL